MTPLRLHYNENTAGCSPAVLEALRSITREEIATYPEYGPVTARCARAFGVEAGWVQLTNGLDEGLQMAALAAVRGVWPPAAALATRHASPSPPPEILIVEPAFEMYAVFAAAAGASLVQVECEAEFRFSIDRLLAAVTPATRLIFLTDPNNPTGSALPGGAIERAAAAAPQAIVFVDEAYADFSGRTAIGALLDRRRNVIVGRTFAKAYGLAGLRAGAMVAHPDTLDLVRPLLEPFSVNVCAVRALGAALEDH